LSGNDKPNLDDGRIEGKASSPLPGTYINNFDYFLKRPMHGKNEHGTCGSVAAQLLLSYNNYYNDRRIIAPEYLNGGWRNLPISINDRNNYNHPEDNPNACADPMLMTPKTTGSSDFFYKAVITEIEPGAFFCCRPPKYDANGKVVHSHTGSSSAQVRNGMGNILYDRGLYHPTNSLTINYANVRAQINSQRPVIIGMQKSLGGSDHWVVAYGYGDYTYPTGQTYSGFITHFGYDNYVTENAINVWINSAWCYSYITMQINHTHNYVSTETVAPNGQEMIFRCTECNHRKTDTLFNVSGNTVTGLKYALTRTASISIPTSINNVPITEIGNSAFANLTNLSGARIPGTVTRIGNNAFSNNPKLNSVWIPSSVTVIDSAAFANCPSLTIYAQATGRPAGWNANWNPGNRTVIWGSHPEVYLGSTVVTFLVGTPSRTLTPIDTTATVSITVTGLSSSETVNIGLAENNYGVTLTGNTTIGASGTLTFTYNGTTVTQPSPVSVGLIINPGNSSFSVTLSIADGRYSAIPVTQANITAFNAYANTAAGLTRYYKLTENVTLTGSNNWTAIGPDTYSPFTGSFDGQRYTITNLSINNTTGEYQGMFGVNSGWVTNLGLVNVSITGNANVGGLVGMNYSFIENCYTAGTVKGTGTNVGGLVGVNSYFVEKCYSTANVEGKGYTGGLVGSNTYRVCDCYTTGNVNSLDLGPAGGVAGSNTGTVQNCYATGAVRSGGDYSGGVVGYNSGAIRNTVALNTAICAELNPIGRITGVMRGELTHNYARNAMTVFSYSNGGAKKTNPGLATEDGANVTQTQWNSASWWRGSDNWDGNSFWELYTNVWDIGTNRLPTLRNMPKGSQTPVVR
jgi:hypothetical protein